MSEFLTKVAGRAEGLGGWVRASIGEMDRVMDGFSNVFGSRWRNEMRNHPTAASTKLLGYVLDIALEEMARRMSIDYRAANDEEQAASGGFGCFVFGCGVESKLSLGKPNSSFATGFGGNAGNKNSRILAVKVQSKDYKTTAVFAAFVDLSAAVDADTGWRNGGLQIACADAGIIVPLCGGINRGQKFVNAEYESYRAEETMLQVL